MDSRERKLLLATCFGHFTSHFNMLVFPALVLPLTKLLELDIGQVLGLSFWMYLLFGITALPWGLLADRWGARPILMLFFLGSGLCGLASAVYINDPAILVWTLAGIGFFSGAYHPAGLGLIARGVERVSLGMAYNGIFGNLGLAAGPLFAGLFYWLWGPRAAYLALGFLNLIGLASMFLLVTSEPPRPSGAQARDTTGLLLPFLILLAAMMLGGFVYRGATVTLPAYFELNTPTILQWLSNLWPGDPSANLVATLITSFIFVVGAIGQYVGGRFGDRFDLRWGYLLFHAIAFIAVIQLPYLSNLPLALVAMGYLFFLLGMQPIENTLVARLSPPAFKSTAYGTKFVLTFGIGSLSVKMASAVQETWGISHVFTAIGIATLALLAIIGLLIWRTEPMK